MDTLERTGHQANLVKMVDQVNQDNQANKAQRVWTVQEATQAVTVYKVHLDLLVVLFIRTVQLEVIKFKVSEKRKTFSIFIS